MRYLLLLAILTTICSSKAFPGEPPMSTSTPVETQAFVDRDGDGFDDNAPDQDGDGIPDVADRSSGKTELSQPPSQNDMFAAVQSLIPAIPVFLHNSGSFNYLRLRMSPLTLHRGSFGGGNDFGAGSDIGSGAVMGGACAGGVCGP